MTYDHDNFDDLYDALFGGDDVACAHDTGRKVDAPTRVYRFEMADGVGPYNTRALPKGMKHEDLYQRICHNGKHKGKPSWDCVHLAGENNEQMGVTEGAFRRAHGHAAYACDSPQTLANWFPVGAREFLGHDCGAQVLIYEIPKGGYLMKVGHGEVVFSKPDAKRVGALDPVTLTPISAA